MTADRARQPGTLAAAPVLPAARAAALSMLQDMDLSLGDLGEVVSTDPGLTVVLLRAANSVHSASRRRIEHARDAMIRIGLTQTKRLVAAAVVGGAFDDLDECGIDLDAFWAYSLATAVAAEDASKSTRLRPAAFSAGLLHDIGRLTLAASAPLAYPAISARAASESIVLGAERALFGEDHAAAGARMLHSWGLSEDLVATVIRHHDVPAGEIGGALAEARSLVEAVGYSDGLPRSFERAP